MTASPSPCSAAHLRVDGHGRGVRIHRRPGHARQPSHLGGMVALVRDAHEPVERA